MGHLRQANETEQKLGGAIQVTVAATIWSRQIHIHHPPNPPFTFGTTGEPIHLLWHGGQDNLSGTHYDMLVPNKPGRDPQEEDQKKELINERAEQSKVEK